MLKIKRFLNRWLDSDQAFRDAISQLPCTDLGQPIQTAKYAPNMVSIIEDIPGYSREKLTHMGLKQRKQKFSVKKLTGVCAGKTPGNRHVESFLDYGRALQPLNEYNRINRIGYETDEDFQTNCNYLRDKLSHIAGNKDGVPLVYHRDWDDTYYLSNIDGGNHFAAVYRQCIEQSRDFTFECRIQHQLLDKEKCRKIIAQQGLLIVPTIWVRPLSRLLIEYDLKTTPYSREFQPEKSLLSINLNFSADGAYLYECLCKALPLQSYFNLSLHLYDIL